MSARTVAVCGSCATRDNFNSRFNPDHKRWYDLVAEANQVSMLSLMSPAVEPEIVPEDGMNDHQAWTIRTDLTRRFLGDLARTRPDFLLLDFSGDAWFGALRLPDGRYITDNQWKVGKTAFYRRALAEGATPLSLLDHPDEYRALWREAVGAFAAFVAEHSPQTRVVLHRLRSVGTVVRGPEGRPASLQRVARLAPIKIRRINQLRTELDDYATTTFGWDAIDLRAERYSSTVDHPWGPFWVHYTLDYHRRFLAELHLRDLTERVEPEIADRIAAVAGAGREHLLAQSRFVERVDLAQRRQIRELSELDPVRAGRRALVRRRARTRGTDR